ncbi:MAG: DUF2863 family protein [Rhodocyclaceae bacterium]|nr:DUF2863 family protein [Rhodocyclaceae bacterium]
MKRTRSSRHARLTPRIETLVQLAEAYARSCSRLEDAWWERELGALIGDLLDEHNEEGLNAALDHLHSNSSRAYDMLADMIEAQCECLSIAGPGATFSVQLIALPVLAWSRFNIPSGTIPAPLLDTLRVQLQAHVLAADARVALANFLFSPDHLPQGFCPTAELTRELGEAAIHHRSVSIDPALLPESMKFLSDSRYLLGAVVVPQGQPLFRWQEKDGKRENAERNWLSQGGNAMQPLLTGCASELLLPQAYFSACRDTDRASRPFSLQASIEFLKTTLDIPAAGLRAVIAPFYEEDLVEYRVGFTQTADRQVIYGLVWPLLEAEDENSDVPAQIETLLKQHGIEQVVQLDHRFPVEFCDDCGTPLYPSPDGEIVHAEMPEEEADALPKHLH